LRNEIVQIVVGFQDDISTPAAVAAARARLWARRSRGGMHASLAAMARSGEYLISSTNIPGKKKGEVDDLAMKLGCFNVSCSPAWTDGIDGHYIHPMLPLSKATFPSTNAKESPVPASPNVVAGDELGAALADEDASGSYKFAAEALHAQPLLTLSRPLRTLP